MRPGVAKAGFNACGSHANAVSHAVPDPMTNNYRYKLGRGRVERMDSAAEKADRKGLSLKPRGLA
jgi:arsenite oxidase large subunit